MSGRSSAELLLASQLDGAGIPYEREYRFGETFGRRFRADFAVFQVFAGMVSDQPWLLIEVDGATWTLGRHNRPSAIPREYERTAIAAIEGYRMIRATTEQVNDGTVLRWIRAALGIGERAA